MNRHDHLKGQWAHGQVWETRVDGCEQWVPVGDGGRAEPAWDERQEYRPMDPLERCKAIRERVAVLEAEVERLVAEHNAILGTGRVDADDIAWAKGAPSA